ncbi:MULTISPECIES: transketolase [unclassified Actinomyces]|uniref:transketolase n=1 Tax=unclassified Actinomyces TaxID=2609248 RepID=UPI002017B87D|nr:MULTISPECIES: transketolase [unclassified Actinomyces]MCL3777321.1 transketolase [Actinomyces sp. AC-20-1]MCL3789655.1 transketolase [Actinomyces sp. 187325]MCL3792180.1 transketolase [Actinomyces sp. 186855]MCL3794812.1 transketolase [Actinomyces sp. 217892]
MTLDVDLPVVGRTAPGATRQEVIAHLKEGARLIRMKDLANVVNAGQGHIGGEFSITDVLATLYLHVANITPDNLDDPDRDRVILSKGHAANALYCTFAAAGLLDPAALDTFIQPGSALNGHPARTKVRGVEANTGPLGHGLPIAVGDAIAAKIDGSPRRVFVLTGDGELQEGSNWEALMCAAHQGLDNLVVITDRNHLQQGARTEDTNDLSPLDAKARAFGAHVVEVDAHDHGQLLDALQAPPQPGRPTYIIAHSHKGHPISFMSDNQPWHHKLPSLEEAEAALAELEALK